MAEIDFKVSAIIIYFRKTMGKNKLARFEENLTFPNLFQVSYEDLKDDKFEMKGRWHEQFFGNDNPIVLELGCGKGEYTVALARKYLEKNFIGIDIKGARLWRGCKTSNEEGMKNVAFIRTRIQLIEQFFAAGEVSEIWVTFPDPQPKKPNKRLTSERSPGELRKSLCALCLMFMLVTAVCWGWLGERRLALAAIFAWGPGDAAAALIGKRYGKTRLGKAKKK